MTTADHFEYAMLCAGYSPSTARTGKPAAAGGGPDWAKRLYAAFESTGKVPQRRGEHAVLASRIIACEGVSAHNAYGFAACYLTWAKAGKPETATIQRGSAVCTGQFLAELDDKLSQIDLFFGLDPEAFGLALERSSLSTREAAQLLGVSRQTVRNWKASIPLAPEWATNQLAELAAKTRPEGATEKPCPGEE